MVLRDMATSGLGSFRLVVGLDDLKGLFSPIEFHTAFRIRLSTKQSYHVLFLFPEPNKQLRACSWSKTTELFWHTVLKSPQGQVKMEECCNYILHGLFPMHDSSDLVWCTFWCNKLQNKNSRKQLQTSLIEMSKTLNLSQQNFITISKLPVLCLKQVNHKMSVCRDKRFWYSQFFQKAQTSQVWDSYLKNGQREKPRNVLDVKYQLGLLAVTSGVPQRTTCYLWLGPNIRAVPSTALSGSLGAAIGFHLEDKLEREVCQMLSCNGAAVKANGGSWVSLQSWSHHWAKQGWSPGKLAFLYHFYH